MDDQRTVRGVAAVGGGAVGLALGGPAGAAFGATLAERTANHVTKRYAAGVPEDEEHKADADIE